jgi:hypothetical protein
MDFDGNCSADSGESAAQENDFRGGRRWKFKKMSRYAVLKESFGEGGELGMGWSDTTAAF